MVITIFWGLLYAWSNYWWNIILLSCEIWFNLPLEWLLRWKQYIFASGTHLFGRLQLPFAEAVSRSLSTIVEQNEQDLEHFFRALSYPPPNSHLRRLYQSYPCKSQLSDFKYDYWTQPQHRHFIHCVLLTCSHDILGLPRMQVLGCNRISCLSCGILRHINVQRTMILNQYPHHRGQNVQSKVCKIKSIAT